MCIRDRTYTVPKCELYIKLPFYEHIFTKQRKELTSLLRDFFPQLNINLVFSASRKISSFCNHKDRTPVSLRSSIIYKFSCDSCDAVYIGSTLRQFYVRIDEHRGVSTRTKTWLNSPAHSSILSLIHISEPTRLLSIS